MTIPAILHQIAPTHDVPPHLQGFQESWLRLNPHWEYRLWTDETLEAWIAEQAPDFLPLFRAFPRSVCRADLGRYLLLERLGGVYADLDCQCLQPLAPLLSGRELVIAPEPDAHQQQPNVLERDLSRLLCPSFLASVSGHHFWSDVLAALQQFDPASILSCDDVLAATGPFLLSRVFAAKDYDERHIVSSGLIYPFTKADCWQGLIFDPQFWTERTQQAVVAHYWDGSWFRPAQHWRSGVPSQAPVHVKEPPCTVLVSPSVVGRNTGSAVAPPLISCLMVTRGRPRQAARSIACFLSQTYERRELIIVDDDPDSQLAALIAAMGSSHIRHVRLPDQGLKLGALRNIALEHAIGDYICQWDDDDLYDPVRLEVQWKALHSCGGQASVLARWTIWWPRSQRLAVSCYRDWEGSLLCERSLMPRYPEWPRGEDSEVLERLRETVRLVRIDLPRLYIYICHGANTFEVDHFEHHWHQASLRWSQSDSKRLELELDRRVPLLRTREDLIAVSPPPRPAAVHSAPRDPRVLILTPVKDGELHIHRYRTLLEHLEFNPDRLSVALLEGDSVDASQACLEELCLHWSGRFRRVELYRHDLHPPTQQHERWEPVLQRDRRERLAQIRNRLLIAALEDEDWVLWLDVDLTDYPSDLLRQLLAAGRDIVTANCLGQDGDPFDLNSFRVVRDSLDALPEEPLLDGLRQPQPGQGRLYVDEFRSQPLVELDAVGGTVLLVRADLHRNGLLFPTYPIDGLIETEGFSRVAKAQGLRSWALPQLIVRHG